MSAEILVIEDDKILNKILVKQLIKMGYQAAGVITLADAKEYLTQQEPDLIISDMRLPDGLCLDYIPEINDSIPVIILTAYGTVKSAVHAIQAGVADYLTKPINSGELMLTVARVLENLALKNDHQFCRASLEKQSEFKSMMIGNSEALLRVKELITAVAPSDMTVLILGESGSGKELMARAIHQNSDRVARNFVAVDCCTLQESLFESELFGHEKGSFTGAINKKKGLIEGAEGGTLFLDEIGEIPPGIQAKLLHILETGYFRRVGGTKDLVANVRIVSATNRDLKEMSETGGFRADLYYRLEAFTLFTPPLRDRRDDIPELVRHFIQNHNFSMRVKKNVTHKAMRKLIAYDWPGNVRELKNVVERAIILSRNNRTITEGNLTFGACMQQPAKEDFMSFNYPQGKEPTLAKLEEAFLKVLLDKYAGHRATVAKVMGISERHVYRLISKYGLSKGKSKAKTQLKPDSATCVS